MFLWRYIFLFSILAVLYNYAGYALIIYLLNKLKNKREKKSAESFYPSVSFIVAAFNEEDCIEKKILNSLEQQYPSQKMDFIFIADGSTDATTDIIKKYPSIRLLYLPERKGKSAALNRAVLAAGNDILVFSDANTFLNPAATSFITRHYKDQKVGGVAGEKKVLASTSGDEVGAGEGLYWKYESFLKKLDSEFYSVVGAAGELFSLRRNLFEPVEQKVILDDFVISMKVAQKGYRIVYEPEAYAMELPSFSIGDEQKRKVRIAAGGFQAMVILRSLLKFWRQPRLSFLYVSHRVLRWTLSPLCLILALVSNLILCFQEGSFFKLIFLAQVFFYGAALLGSRLTRGRGMLRIAKLAYYFVFMNLSVIQGFSASLGGNSPLPGKKSKEISLR
jgi:biofilm PGA synthesis N-glycosyltransferase PgaC